MTVKVEVEAGQLTSLVKEVQAGNEVLLTLDDKPVAKMVPALQREIVQSSKFHVRSLKGHEVLTPVISQEELADEMFGRE